MSEIVLRTDLSHNQTNVLVKILIGILGTFAIVLVIWIFIGLFQKKSTNPSVVGN